MSPHVDDLAAFLSLIDAAPAHLVGSSWGGFISLLTAIRYPNLVRTLVLEEPPVLTLFVSAPPRPAELLRLLVTRPRTAIAILQFGAATIAGATKAFRRGENDEAMRIFARGVLGEAALARLSETRIEHMRENLGAARAQLLGAGFPPLTDDEVRSIRAPVLLLTGQWSPALFLRLTDRLEELLPSVGRAEIPAASHLMHEENAAAVNEAIVEFIAWHREGRQPSRP